MRVEDQLAVRKAIGTPIYRFLLSLYNKRIIRVYIVNWPDFMADIHDPGDICHMEFKSGRSYYCRFLRSETYRGEEEVGIYEITRDIQEFTLDQFRSVVKGCGIRFSRVHRKEERKKK